MPFAKRATLALLLLMSILSGASAAAEGKAIPLSPEVKKDLAILGDGVVWKAVLAEPITDVTEWLNPGSGTWQFEIVAGKNAGKSQVETYRPLAGKGVGERWQRKIGDEYLEYIWLGPHGACSKKAETALEFGYRSTFAPATHEAGNFEPGQSVEIDTRLAVSTQKEPSKTRYTGNMKPTVTYEDAYQVHTPAGTFSAVLMKTDVKIHVGPADVEDTQYIFYAKRVGKVAEIEAQRVSAVLIYRSKSKTAKVLTKAPSH